MVRALASDTLNECDWLVATDTTTDEESDTEIDGDSEPTTGLLTAEASVTDRECVWLAETAVTIPTEEDSATLIAAASEAA